MYFLVAGSRRSNARLSMVDFMPFSRDLSQEQLIGCVNKRVNSKTVMKMSGIPSICLIKLTSGLSISSRGDTTNTNLQNMEPVSETDQEQVPEDLGKLTEVDKARTGRVNLKMAFDFTSDGVKCGIKGTPLFAPKLFTHLCGCTDQYF